jgi:hypothetical protein
MAATIREVKELPMGVSAPDGIKVLSLREALLRVIYDNKVPVELSYNKEQVPAYLIGYDRRYHDEVYREIAEPHRTFMVPGKHISRIAVAGGDDGVIMQMAAVEWMRYAYSAGTDDNDE